MKWLFQPLLMLVAGLVLSVMATRHFRRVSNPLLDLSAFKVQTFAIATLSGGTASRLAINATPFLLPLVFQLGFGLSSIEAGAYLLVYFLGSFEGRSFWVCFLGAGLMTLVGESLNDVLNPLLRTAKITKVVLPGRRKKDPMHAPAARQEAQSATQSSIEPGAGG